MSVEVVYDPGCPTNPMRTLPANPCCDPSDCPSDIGLRCYNPYSASQSFFLNTKKRVRHLLSSSCNPSPTCADGGCSGVNRSCTSRNGKHRITTYQKTGSNASAFRGGGSEKEYLRRIKSRSTKVVRGNQTTQSTLIRSSRPVQNLPCSTLGRPNTYGTGVMLARVPRRSQPWNKPQTKDCCPEIAVNEENGIPQKLIGPGNPCVGPCTCGGCGPIQG